MCYCHAHQCFGKHAVKHVACTQQVGLCSTTGWHPFVLVPDVQPPTLEHNSGAFGSPDNAVRYAQYNAHHTLTFGLLRRLQVREMPWAGSVPALTGPAGAETVLLLWGCCRLRRCCYRCCCRCCRCREPWCQLLPLGQQHHCKK